MTDAVKIVLFDGCFVRLADGSVCGPLRSKPEFVNAFVFGDTTWLANGGEGFCSDAKPVTAVFASLQEAAAPASDYVAVKRSDLANYMKGEPHPSTEASYPGRYRKFIKARDRLRAAMEQQG